MAAGAALAQGDGKDFRPDRSDLDRWVDLGRKPAGPSARKAVDGPKSLGKADVEAWMKGKFHTDGWYYHAPFDGVLVFVKHEDFPTDRWPLISTWYRTEFLPGSGEGSELYQLEVDCSRQRTKTLAVHSYPKPDLQGVPKKESLPVADARWEYPLPTTADRDILNYTCLVGRFLQRRKEG